MKKITAFLSRKLSKRREDSGFTLIELVVVVVVVGILTAIAVPTYGAIQDVAHRNSVKSSAVTAFKAAEVRFLNGESDYTSGKVIAGTSGAGLTVTIFGVDDEGNTSSATPPKKDAFAIEAMWKDWDNGDWSYLSTRSIHNGTVRSSDNYNPDARKAD